MLSELVVQDLGVIERAELSLGAGSAALTGETGAGKTLLVAAVGLLLGGRADRTLVRRGATDARVEGRFLLAPDHPAVRRLIEDGILEVADEGTEVEVVIGRVIASDGRSGKARINGRLVPVALLGEIGTALVEIAGQHQHQRISKGQYQRTLLDHHAGPEAVELARKLRETVRALKETAKRIEELSETERARHRELDILRFEIGEIEGASITVGESARLNEEAARLENADRLASGLGRAVGALRDEGRAEDLIGDAESEVRALAEYDGVLEAIAGRLESLRLEASDVAAELSARTVSSDPALLDETRARIDAIARLLRKYGDDEDEVLAYLDRARARAEELAGADTDLERWEAEHRDATARAEKLSADLSALRHAGAQALEADVMKRLASLAMGAARFQVDLEACALDEGGAEEVVFRIATNAGETPLPIAKVASGGELSRLALALHLVQGAGGEVRTMIFDEVDAGVGGETAQAVGRALGELARSGGLQVLVVTHLPQVAAFSDDHLRVQKIEVGDRTTAGVVRLEREARIEELSRMLAGLPDSEVAQEHARELLELADGAPVA